MSFIERKKAAIHKLHAGLIGRSSDIAAVKYAMRQLEGRLKKKNVKDYPNIFYFYGQTGVGKSTVLQTIYQDCERGELGYQPLCVWLDCKQLPASQAIAKESLMLGLAESMMDLTEDLVPYFKPMFQLWHQYSKEAGSAPAPAASPAMPTPQAPRRNSASSAYGAMASLPSGKGSVKSIARNVNKNMQAMQASQRQQVQAPTRDITQEMLEQFAKTIDKVSSSCPVVFFIDHYEDFEAHDEWFRQTFLLAFQREIIVVIAGENNLHDIYQYQFGNVSDCRRIRPFTAFETDLYFRHFNRLQNPDILQATVNLTGGVPVAVSMISSALQHLTSRADMNQIMDFLAFPDEDYGDQLDKYITYIALDEFANSDKNMLAALCIMRSFEPQLYQHLSGVMNVRRTLDHLAQRYPFINAYGEMSSFVTRTLRGYFKQEMPQLYQELNESAYTFYAELLAEHQNDPTLLAESMFYYFHVTPKGSYQHLMKLLSHYLHQDLDLCDELCRAALDASIPSAWKENIRVISEGLGAFRKKDSRGSQSLLSAISKGEEGPPQDESFYLNYLEAMS